MTKTRTLRYCCWELCTLDSRYLLGRHLAFFVSDSKGVLVGPSSGEGGKEEEKEGEFCFNFVLKVLKVRSLF